MPKTERNQLQISQDVALVAEYINKVWNQNSFGELSAYLHDHYIDHSIPYASLQNREGFFIYLRELARSVSHATEILALSMVGELVVCQIRISVSAPCGQAEKNQETALINGYRIFRMCENRILEHWEILDSDRGDISGISQDCASACRSTSN